MSRLDANRATGAGPDASEDAPADTPGADAAPPIVAIGASAGGLAAVRTFLRHVPEDLHAALVVVVHLSPEHPSRFAELLQSSTPLPVTQVEGETELRADAVYVIPPNRNLSAIDTHLRLSALENARSDRAPIDHFMRTLAQTHDGNSAAVILTGTGSDGATGVKHVKEAGGLVVVQDPSEAEYDSMPRSAIMTARPDVVAPLAELPGRIADYFRRAQTLRVPDTPRRLPEPEREALVEILGQVRRHNDHDFRSYKRSTVLRRLRHRMQVRGAGSLADYARLLEGDADEVERLHRDLLITVTDFFRDPEAFRVLEEKVVPRLFEGKQGGDQVRAWVIGCATGEEAYSVAMLLLEHAVRCDDPPDVQVFASDVHAGALAEARIGRYPDGIVEDVGEERTKRFFVREDSGYRVKKRLRETVLFAPHDVLANAPFARIDLITFRNVLIYLNREVHDRVFAALHYALAPDGYLMLGASESVERSSRFRTEDEGHRIYRRNEGESGRRLVPGVPARREEGADLSGRGADGHHRHASLGQVHERVLDRHGPPSLLVNEHYDIVHLSEHAGRYLKAQAGEPTHNVLKQVRPELRIELRSLLFQAVDGGTGVRSRPIPVAFEERERHVSMWAKAAQEPHLEGYVLVTFEESEPPRLQAGSDAGATPESTVAALEAELDHTRERLQVVIEEYETSQEEMRSSNEELQSINEELKSTAEELETSKEELESMNEELVAVSQEYKNKIEELNAFSNDQHNLLRATEVAVLFLDENLNIKRITPKVHDLFNILSTDLGRPVQHVTHKLGRTDLQHDARRVLESGEVVERDIESENRRCFRMRVMPYRAADEAVSGVLVSFTDVTELQRLRRRLAPDGEELPGPEPREGPS